MGTLSLLTPLAAASDDTVANVVAAGESATALLWLIPLLPLLGFVVSIFLPRVRDRAAIAASAGAFGLAVAVFLHVRGHPGTFITEPVTFIDVGGFTVQWGFMADQLTSVMLLVVTGVGLLVHVYSIGYMHGDRLYSRFFGYLNLFLAAMLMLVLGNSLLMTFIGWEGVGLASYLLIGFWFEDMSNSVAAKKAFVTNRVGDVAFMVAMFLAFDQFGTLDYFTLDHQGILEQSGLLTAGTATALVVLVLLAASAKSAQIPLFVWLPDAMAGPTPVSALMHAATMVTAGVFLLARMSPVLVQSLTGMAVVAWTGGLTALLAALIATRQDGIKKVLAYSTVSQLGYMVMGIGVGAFAEGIFHLVTHAFFKGLLFLAAGSVMHAMANVEDIWRMGGLRDAMPVTFATSAVAWLAISGFPLLSGFFSKDQILTATYDHGFLGLWILGVLTAVITAFYMTRWFLLVFMGTARWTEGATIDDPHHGPTALHPHESPRTMTAPLVVLAVLAAVGGAALNFVHHGPLWTFLQPAVGSIEGLGFEHAGSLTEPALIAISIAAALAGIGLGWAAYGPRQLSRGVMRDPIRGALGELFARRFFVDDAYEVVFVRAGGVLANAAAWFDRTVVDGAVNGLAAVSIGLGDVTRRVQTGRLRTYLAVVVGGVVVLAAVMMGQVR